MLGGKKNNCKNYQKKKKKKKKKREGASRTCIEKEEINKSYRLERVSE